MSRNSIECLVTIREPDGNVEKRFKRGFVIVPSIGDHIPVANTTLKVVERMIHAGSVELIAVVPTENFYTGQKLSS